MEWRDFTIVLRLFIRKIHNKDVCRTFVRLPSSCPNTTQFFHVNSPLLVWYKKIDTTKNGSRWPLNINQVFCCSLNTTYPFHVLWRWSKIVLWIISFSSALQEEKQEFFTLKSCRFLFPLSINRIVKCAPSTCSEISISC